MAANSATAPSIITSDVVMIGTLSTKSDVQIEGRIDGGVRCVSLVIGNAGHVNGNILAEDITIRGRVKGSIRARRVFLCSASRVEGNILMETFAVEAGAFFEGNCRHSDSLLAEAPKGSRIPHPPKGLCVGGALKSITEGETQETNGIRFRWFSVMGTAEPNCH